MSRYRKKLSSRKSKRMFRRGATRVNRRNNTSALMRGGIRF